MAPTNLMRPTIADTDQASRESGYWHWKGSLGGADYCFIGKGPAATPSGVLEALGETSLRASWLHQIHSTALVEASAGESGTGDGLHTGQAGLALSIQTADCVPVLLASSSRAVAIHAGWRGIAAGIVGSTLAELSSTGLEAIIGPAIGPCCYEVDEEVAAAVEKALPSGGPIRWEQGSKPHIDLQLAVQLQLETAGVATLRSIRVCTRCHPERLWSYRRDGARAGRNLAILWLRS